MESADAKAAKGEVLYEFLAVNGTIVNFSTISFGGSNPQLEWGKWVKSPSFPVEPDSTLLFKAEGRDSSLSGIKGKPGIILTYNGKEMKINFACPLSHPNYFDVVNDIPEVDVTVEWGPGPSGSPVTGTVTIKNKPT